MKPFSASTFLTVSLICTLAHGESPNYEEHIKPLFRDSCLKCHNADEANADLDLSSFAAVMKGGSSGVVVKAGLPERSQLYRAVAHLDGAEAMPPESPRLPAAKLTLIRDWIRGGLIAGKGGKSQLRAVTAMLAPAAPGAPAPLPQSLPAIELTRTTRPPIPQAMAVSPGARLIAVSGHEQVMLFGTDSEKTEYHILGALPFPEGTLHDLKFSRSGSLILAAGGRGAHSGRTVLFDVKTGRRVAEIGDEVDSVLAADVTPDHRFVALGGPARIVKIFNTATGEMVHRIKKHTDWVTAVTFSPDGRFVATGDRSGGVHIWETEKGAIVFTLDEHKVRISAIRWRADGAIVATAAEDGTLILWSTRDGFPVRNIDAHSSAKSRGYSRRTGILALDFGNDGRLLTTGRDGLTRVWSGEGQQLIQLRTDSGLPVSASFVSGTQSAVVGSFDGSLHIFDLKSKSVSQRLSTAAEQNHSQDTRAGQ